VRGELAELRAARRARVASLEDELLSGLARQLSELSVALNTIRDLGAVLAELRTLRDDAC